MKSNLFSKISQIKKDMGLSASLLFIDNLIADCKIDEAQGLVHKHEIAQLSGDYESALEFAELFHSNNYSDVRIRLSTAIAAIAVGNLSIAMENLNLLLEHELKSGRRYFWDTCLLMKAYLLLNENKYVKARKCLSEMVNPGSESIFPSPNLPHLTSSIVSSMLEGK